MEKTVIQTVRPTQSREAADLSRGLAVRDVPALREKHGSNQLTKRKRPGFLSQFFANLNDPIIRILLGALVLNILFLFPDVDWYECGGIAFAVFISAFVSTVSEYGSGKAFDKLYAELGSAECTVLRDGMWQPVGIGDLVCMDVIRLRQGDIVPADGILLSGCVLADESSLTGESQPVAKQKADFTSVGLSALPGPPKPGNADSLFRGSVICSGECTVLVTCVGDKTVYGQAAAELQDTDPPSPLKERLGRLAGIISKIGYVSAAFVAGAHLFHSFYLESGMNLSVMWLRMQDLSFVWSECLAALTMAISILVVAVPEGLPMMITVVLSSNMKKMMESGVLVRKLVGIETSGCLSILFTDKTGTLTTGALTVSGVRTGAAFYDAAGTPSPLYLEILQTGAAVCGGSGNPTETAIETYLRTKAGIKQLTPYAQIPFDSAQKYSAGLYRETGYIRGAPEYLLPRCTSWVDETGRTQPMDTQRREELFSVIREAASHCGRVVLQAQFQADCYSLLKNGGPESVNLSFHALWILQDQVREQVPDSVRQCQEAGIQVVMITGDNEWTAASIARRTGILSEQWQFFEPSIPVRYGTELVLRGQDLQNLSADALASILPSVRVISRVTPTDKSRLIRTAQAAGHVVGMTGDGINDAPALKGADVGFAMGSGTDVAREAGDIVITDDNFVSIGKAILFGRTIFQSIRKFIVFQLIMNLSAVGVSLLGPLVGIEHPVTVIQMLWVNIIMDTLGALAFAGEAPLPVYLRQAPLSRNEPILTKQMVQQIFISAGFMILLCMGFLTSSRARYSLGHGDMEYFLTVFFALFVFCGVAIAFTVRTPRLNLFAGLPENRAFLIIMPAVACIQLLILYFGGDVFRTVPLDADTLFWCGILAMSVLPLDALRKWIFRSRNR